MCRCCPPATFLQPGFLLRDKRYRPVLQRLDAWCESYLLPKVAHLPVMQASARTGPTPAALAPQAASRAAAVFVCFAALFVCTVEAVLSPAVPAAFARRSN